MVVARKDFAPFWRITLWARKIPGPGWGLCLSLPKAKKETVLFKAKRTESRWNKTKEY
jgi:hypothetical protein